MSNDVIIFTPKFDLDAAANLKDFIAFAESLTALNANLNYSSHYWEGVANFTKFGISSKNRDTENLLHESIIPFAKAYLQYSQTLRRAKTLNEMKAIRAIEAVMVRNHGLVDICAINSTTLDLAAQEIRDHYSASAAYHGGAHLQKMQVFLSSKKIIKPFKWFNPISRAADVIEKVGKKGNEIRNKKLPDENALIALAEIFALGEDSLSPRDIFTTSSLAILMSAPARASELFYLKSDCIHEDTDRKSGDKVMGLKWYSGKGYGHEVSWIPSVMEDVVKEAVSRLQKLTQPARNKAKALEDQNTDIQEQELNFIQFSTGEAVNIKWSEALYTLFGNQLHTIKSNDESKLWMPHIDTLNEDLAPTKKNIRGTNIRSNTQSIFARHQYPALTLKTHQLRHLLNTIATVNGMDTELLTKWAGRADKKQNRIYNHKTPEDYNKQMVEVKTASSKDSLIPTIEIITPESLQEMNTGAPMTIHETEFGACTHDYITSPCSKHRNCVVCDEQVCIKGDKVKLALLEERLARELIYLEADKRAVDEGTIGADRHYQKRLEIIKNCRGLIEKLKDDTLPDGTLIKLSPDQNMSHLDKAMDINHKKRLPKIKKVRSSGPQTVANPPKSLAKFRALRNK